jgi:hypothetical protein
MLFFPQSVFIENLLYWSRKRMNAKWLGMKSGNNGRSSGISGSDSEDHPCMDSDEDWEEEDHGLKNLEQQDQKDQSQTTTGSRFWANWEAGRWAGNKTTAWAQRSWSLLCSTFQRLCYAGWTWLPR